MTETKSTGAWAIGLATFAGDRMLDAWFPDPKLSLDGGELEVDVDEALHVDLTGWAVPVYRGELSPDLVAELGSMA